MIKLNKITTILVCLAILALLITACGPAEEITQVLSEEQFQQEEQVCSGASLQGDFQPGKVVCTGQLEGEDVVIELVAQVVGGNAILQITSFTHDGTPFGPEDYADFNAEIAAEPTLPEEGYEFISVDISDTEMTFTSKLK